MAAYAFISHLRLRVCLYVCTLHRAVHTFYVRNKFNVVFCTFAVCICVCSTFSRLSCAVHEKEFAYFQHFQYAKELQNSSIAALMPAFAKLIAFHWIYFGGGREGDGKWIILFAHLCRQIRKHSLQSASICVYCNRIPLTSIFQFKAETHFSLFPVFPAE